MKKSAIVTVTELSACATVVIEAAARAAMVTTRRYIAGDANGEVADRRDVTRLTGTAHICPL